MLQFYKLIVGEGIVREEPNFSLSILPGNRNHGLLMQEEKKRIIIQ